MMAVLSTAAMMAALTPETFTADPAASVLAASGWVEEDGSLRYIDSDGYYMTNTWKNMFMGKYGRNSLNWIRRCFLRFR